MTVMNDMFVADSVDVNDDEYTRQWRTGCALMCRYEAIASYVAFGHILALPAEAAGYLAFMRMQEHYYVVAGFASDAEREVLRLREWQAISYLVRRGVVLG